MRTHKRDTRAIDEANVTISIKGLALSHYRKTWETRFLRDFSGHDLKLIVKKNGEQLYFREIDRGERIIISNSKAKEVPTHFKAGNSKDISHLIDFNSSELCGTDFKFKNQPMTLLSTADACFYTKTISKDPYTIRKNGKEVFTRRVGIITGGDIVSLDETKITFAGSPDKPIVLKAEPGVIYEIIFDNDCENPPKDGTSDFDKFNDVIDCDEEFTLTASRDPDVMAYMDPPDGDEDEEEDGEGKKPPCTSGLGG